LVVATGYNGSLPKMPHCDDVGCEMEDGHCVRVVHAEENAIFQAAKLGVSLDGCTAYVTASPCKRCFKALVSVGVKRIVFKEFYRDAAIFEACKANGIELVQL
jgi:dCMP deaminase